MMTPKNMETNVLRVLREHLEPVSRVSLSEELVFLNMFGIGDSAIFNRVLSTLVKAGLIRETVEEEGEHYLELMCSGQEVIARAGYTQGELKLLRRSLSNPEGTICD